MSMYQSQKKIDSQNKLREICHDRKYKQISGKILEFSTLKDCYLTMFLINNLNETIETSCFKEWRSNAHHPMILLITTP